MPSPFDRDRFRRQLRFSLGTMLVLTALYAFFVFMFFPAKLNAAATFPMEVALLLVGGLLLGGGIFAWFRLPTARMMAMPARKLGKAERETGWPPRAEALRKQLQFILMLLQSAAVAAVFVIAIGSMRLAAVSILLGVVMAGAWIWKQVPAKVHEVLG